MKRGQAVALDGRRLRLPGLGAPVEAIDDRWGVPHLFAASEEDAYFAQGFVHARDRLFQLETSRRAACGTLSELFGRRALEIDRFMRRLGLHRAAAVELGLLDQGTRTCLEAYAAGVNAGARASRRPLEFLLLRARFRQWSVADTLAFTRLMAFSLAANWESELARAELVSRLGPEIAAAVEPRFSELHPSVLGEIRAAGPSLDSLRRHFEEMAGALGIRGGASNGWAVSPARTQNGRAILANDPHLSVGIPNTWYEVELSAPGLHVTGASIPGMPGVLIGHNERIGWGITAAGADVQDAVLLTPDDLATARRIREEIRVRGRRPEMLEVLETAYGPVLDRQPDGRGVALRSTVLEPRPLLAALFALGKAGDWASFRAAARLSVAPPLCYTYADVEGNIGFQLFGLVPKRRGTDGYLPWPAGDTRFEWDGFVPFEEIPHALNPAAGVVVNANNQIEPGPELLVPGEYVDGYRAKRIRQLLDGRQGLQVADMQAVQGDIYAVHADELLEAIADWRPEDPEVHGALTWLRAWDREVEAGSAEAALFEAFTIRLLWNALESRIGELARLFVGRPERGPGVAPPLVWRVLSLVVGALRPGSAWFASPEIRGTVLERSIKEALAELEALHGRDRTRWEWGRMHQLTFRHHLGSVPLLGRLLNRGPYRMAGDMNTVMQAAYLTYDAYDVKAWTVSYRQVLDMGNWSNCWSMHAPGQSGRPRSRHYDDLIEPWRRIAYHPMCFGRDSVMRHAEAITVLEPL